MMIRLTGNAHSPQLYTLQSLGVRGGHTSDDDTVCEHIVEGEELRRRSRKLYTCLSLFSLVLYWDIYRKLNQLNQDINVSTITGTIQEEYSLHAVVYP